VSACWYLQYGLCVVPRLSIWVFYQKSSPVHANGNVSQNVLTIPVSTGFVVQDQYDPEIEQYMISSALMVSGLCSFVQVARFQLPTFGLYRSGRIFLGTGMVRSI
jgi:hypothetical protein